MDVHSIHMQNVCIELNQKVQEEKKRRSALSREEKRELREYRRKINERAGNKVPANVREYADLMIVMWDTRIPPSSIHELEAAAELPFSQKRWLH